MADQIMTTSQKASYDALVENSPYVQSSDKADSSDINTGTDDERYATSLAIAGSNILQKSTESAVKGVLIPSAPGVDISNMTSPINEGFTVVSSDSHFGTDGSLFIGHNDAMVQYWSATDVQAYAAANFLPITLTGEVTNSGNNITLVNNAVTSKELTGYVSGAGTVSPTDSILTAFEKLNGNISAAPQLNNTTFIYVSNEGSNSNNGAPGAPYATPDYALTQITDATLSKPYVLVLNGVFNVTGNFTLKPNISIAGNGSTINVTGNVVLDPTFLTANSYSFLDLINWGTTTLFNLDWSGKAPSSFKTQLYITNNNYLSLSALQLNFFGSNQEQIITTNSFFIGSATFSYKNVLNYFVGNRLNSYSMENSSSAFERCEFLSNIVIGSLNFKNSSTGSLLARIYGNAFNAWTLDGTGVATNTDTINALPTLLNGATYVPTALASGSVLTGYTSGAGAVSATDSVLQAIQKLNGNDALKALDSAVVHNTGTETVGGSKTFSSLITGSISGNAATVTTIPTLSGEVTNSGNALTLVNNAVTGKVLTGYVSGAGTISATDSLLTAFEKLNGNVVANQLLNNTTFIYVSNQGSNSNNGSSSLPWATPDYAFTQITDNTFSKPYALILSPGVYNVSGNLNIKPNISIYGFGAQINVTGNVTFDSSFTSMNSTSSLNDITWNVTGTFIFNTSAKTASTFTTILRLANNNLLLGSALSPSFTGSYQEAIIIQNSFLDATPIESSTAIVNVTANNLEFYQANSKFNNLTNQNTGTGFGRCDMRGGLIGGSWITRSTSTGFQYVMARGAGFGSWTIDGSSIGMDVDSFQQNPTLLNGATFTPTSLIRGLVLSGEISNPTGTSVVLSNAAVIGKVLTGYTPSNSAITASDNILTAIQKLNVPVVLTANRTTSTTTYGAGSAIINTIGENPYSAYNATTSTFTVPTGQAGVYKCSYSLNFTGTASGAGQNFIITTTGYVNGVSTADLTTTDEIPGLASSAVAAVSVQKVFTARLTAGQTMSLSAANTGTVTTVTLTSGSLTIEKISN